MFFRIERTCRPTAVRPVQIHRFRCPHPSHSRLEPTSSRVSSAFLVPIYTSRCKNPPAFCAATGSSDPRGHPPAPTCGRARPRATRSHVPRSQLLRRRRFAPSTQTDAWRLAPSLSLTASHPRVGMGNAFRGLGCAGPGEPATDHHSGTRDR